MYFIAVFLLLFLLPVLSVIAEGLHIGAGADIMWLIGKWFVFWGRGVRLFAAGIKQTLQPEFTAKSILVSMPPVWTASCARSASSISQWERLVLRASRKHPGSCPLQLSAAFITDWRG